MLDFSTQDASVACLLKVPVRSEKNPRMCGAEHGISTVIAEHVIHTSAVLQGWSDPE